MFLTPAVFLFAALVGCSQDHDLLQPRSRELTFQVAATNSALAQFTQQILGDLGRVTSVGPTDSDDVKQWRPSGPQIAEMQNADLIFTNGSAAPFAQWLPHVTLPDSRVVQTANDGLELSEMIAVKDVRIVHSHGPEGEHSHATMVAHTWLDPAAARKQARVIAERLAAIYPAEATQLRARLGELETRFDGLQKEITGIAEGAERPLTVITSAPSLKFFTRALGLTDIHLKWFDLPMPDEAKKQLLAMQQDGESKTLDARFLLFTAEPSSELRAAVESLGLTVVVIELIETHSGGEDYFAIMAANIDRAAPIFARPELAE